MLSKLFLGCIFPSLLFNHLGDPYMIDPDLNLFCDFDNAIDQYYPL